MTLKALFLAISERWTLSADPHKTVLDTTGRIDSFSELLSAHSMCRCRLFITVFWSSSEIFSAYVDALSRLAPQCLFGASPQPVPGIARFSSPCGELTVDMVFGAPQQALKNIMLKADWVIYADELSVHQFFGKSRALFKSDTLVSMVSPVKRLPVGLIESDLIGVYRLDARFEPKRDMSATPRSALIVGAGLAGAFLAWELSRRGILVKLVDSGATPGSGASALFAGIMHPHWQASDSPVTQLTRAGFFAMQPILWRFPQTFLPTGVLDVAATDEEYERWHQALERNQPFPMPANFACLLSTSEAKSQSGLSVRRGGWWFEGAGLVYISRLIRTMLCHPNISVLPSVSVSLVRQADGWCAKNRQGSIVAQADIAVVAAGLGSAEVVGLAPEWLSLSALYGRISLLRDTDLSDLNAPVTGDGYLCTTPEGFCGVGATYELGEKPVLSRAVAHEQNVGALKRLLTQAPEVLCTGFYEGVRAVAADRMPIAGALFDETALRGFTVKGAPEVDAVPTAPGLYVCTGMGSRGITWGLVTAQSVVARICHEPQPITKTLCHSLMPARFLAKWYAAHRNEAIVAKEAS